MFFLNLVVIVNLFVIVGVGFVFELVLGFEVFMKLGFVKLCVLCGSFNFFLGVVIF